MFHFLVSLSLILIGVVVAQLMKVSSLSELLEVISSLGALLGGVGAVTAAYIAVGVASTWKSQIEHQSKHEALIAFKEAVGEWFLLVRRVRSVVHGIGRLKRKMVVGSETELFDLLVECRKHEDKIQLAILKVEASSSGVVLEEQFIKRLNLQIKTVKAAIQQEISSVRNGGSPAETFSDEFMNDIGEVINITLKLKI